jgi:hypothetical protein
MTTALGGTRRVDACFGKVGFLSRDLAARAAGRKASRQPYRCRFCQRWHVGNDERSVVRKRREVRRPDNRREP